MTDFVILGQGLVGLWLHRALQDMGASVTCIESPVRRTASLVSAGMIDPISGQRFALSWRYLETIQSVVSSYQNIEAELGEPLVSPLRIQRLFRDEKDHQVFLKKIATSALPTVIASQPTPLPRHIASPPNGFVTVTGGYKINVARLVKTYRKKFPAIQTPQPNITFGRSGPTYNGLPVKAVINCTGAFAATDSFFSWLPFRNSRGESLTIHAPTLSHADVINNGHWLLPVGHHYYRFGATYMWEDLFSLAKQPGYDQLRNALDKLVNTPYTIHEVSAGTRSILEDSRPVVGPHPTVNGLWIVGGVGSKGTQFSPILANEFAKHLLHQTALHSDVCIDRFYSKYFSF